MLRIVWVFLLVVGLAACQPSCPRELASTGVFEQQPWFDASLYEGEQLAKAMAEFEKSRVTLLIDDNDLQVRIGADEIFRLPYTMEGNTLVAHDADDYYWVLYQRDADTVFSSGIEYRRVK